MSQVGIVIVSHSHKLATAAVDLVAQMVSEETRPPVQVAAGLDETTLGSVACEVDAVTLQGPTLPTVADAMVLAGVVESKSAARRAVREGGAYLNNVKVTDADQPLTCDDFLPGGVAFLRRGKKTIGAVQR